MENKDVIKVFSQQTGRTQGTIPFVLNGKNMETGTPAKLNMAFDCPKVMTYFLETKYCEANLSFQMLENCDLVVADILA